MNYTNYINNHSQNLVDTWKQLYTALILIVALAWNEAIKSVFDVYPKLKKYGPWIYAVCVTIIVFIIIDVVEKIWKYENIKNKI